MDGGKLETQLAWAHGHKDVSVAWSGGFPFASGDSPSPINAAVSRHHWGEERRKSTHRRRPSSINSVPRIG